MTRYTVSPPMLIEKSDREKPWRPIGRPFSSDAWITYKSDCDHYEKYLASLQQIRMSPQLITYCINRDLTEIDDKDFEVRSRCCGRCDGRNDECVTDMICDDHNKQGCDVCYGPKELAYPVTVPKDDEVTKWNNLEKDFYKETGARLYHCHSSTLINYLKSSYTINKNT